MKASVALRRDFAALAALAGLALPRPAGAAPANDLFSDAAPLTGATVQVTATNAGASKEPAEPDHAGDPGGHSVWWRWTAPTEGLVSISTAGTEFYALLAVYTGTSLGGLVAVAADCNGGANTSSVVRFSAESGVTYRVAVDGRNGATGAIALHLDAIGYDFSTLTDSAGYGSRDATGTAARFRDPDAVAVDHAGNLYVADRLNATIRKITPAGVVTTMAGSAGISGSADGLGAAARFSYPGGIAVDSAGNVFVADTGNFTIRRLTPAGLVTTVAGSAGAWGAEDGTGAAARFRGPEALAIDSADTIYVVDEPNYTIRKMTAFGTVTTLAGSARSAGSTDGSGSAARFSFPNGAAVDLGGNVYVADSSSNTIRRITPGGAVTTVAGSVGAIGDADGTGSAALFFDPWGVSVDPSGAIWVADCLNSTVRRMTPDGEVTTVAGLARNEGSADGIGSSARFCHPNAVAADQAGNVYVADTPNNMIRRIAPGAVVTTLAGQTGRWPGIAWADATGVDETALLENPGAESSDASLSGFEGRLRYPMGVAVDGSGTVYAADTFRHVIRRVTPAGLVTTLAGTLDRIGRADGVGSAAGFYKPAQLAMDDAGTLYVADSFNCSIRKISPDGLVSTLAGDPGGLSGSSDGIGAAARFDFPQSVAVDRDRSVYVADAGNDTIRKITPDGVVTTLAGTAGAFGSADGTGSAARFSTPRGIAVDSAGIIYVADSENHTVRKITAGGVVTTLAGSPRESGDADGTGSAARFLLPNAVALDGAGNILVADTGNHVIRQVTPAGKVTTLGGRPGFFGTDDGVGVAARFSSPRAIAVAASGDIYIADADNHTIRLGAPLGAAAITAQPQSQTVPAGTDVSFAVEVQGMATPTYQWYRNNTGIVGATGASLTLRNVRSADAGGYTVVITSGARRLTSAVANLTVTESPTPSATPGASGGGAMGPEIAGILALLAAAGALARAGRTAQT